MARTLFCQRGRVAYRLSVAKCRAVRWGRDLLSGERFARQKSAEALPVLIYPHASLIRRRLGNVSMALQENKARNLALAAPHLDGILIRPGEVFSFWRLVGSVTEKKGYRSGLTIRGGVPDSGIGGGLCQMTNLIHWMVLHSDLTVTEHHHHDGVDLFPDFGRKVPFGSGTSVFYNYIDYRVRNDTSQTYQICIRVDGEYLRGELRSTAAQPLKYHVRSEGEKFVREDGAVYRVGEIWREGVDPRTGNVASRTLLRRNHARVMYDTAGIREIE